VYFVDKKVVSVLCVFVRRYEISFDTILGAALVQILIDNGTCQDGPRLKDTMSGTSAVVHY
jgi:hypothetical protein